MVCHMPLQDNAAAGETILTARAKDDDIADFSASCQSQARVDFDDKPSAEPQLPPTATDHTTDCENWVQTGNVAAIPSAKVRH